MQSKLFVLNNLRIVNKTKLVKLLSYPLGRLFASVVAVHHASGINLLVLKIMLHTKTFTCS